MTSLDAVRARFARNEGLPFTDILTEANILDVLNEHRIQFRNRVFNPITTIFFSLERTGPVDLVVFDIAGRTVRTLVSGVRPAGNHQILWDGTNDAGNPVASGIYLYRLTAGDRTETRKMTLVR